MNPVERDRVEVQEITRQKELLIRSSLKQRSDVQQSGLKILRSGSIMLAPFSLAERLH
jgi:hypothetical protein